MDKLPLVVVVAYSERGDSSGRGTPFAGRSFRKRSGLLVPLMLSSSVGLGSSSCLVQQRCYQDRDCHTGTCDEATGSCVDFECQQHEDCGGFPFECVDNACEVVCSDRPLI